MKQLKIFSGIAGAINQTRFLIKKNSPTILVVGGVITIGSGIVMACKATLKAQDTLEDAKNDISEIHESVERGSTPDGDPYSGEEAKKDLTKAYAHASVQLLKLYAPAAIVTATGLGCVLASNNILRKRYVATAAAYATVDKSFKDYRGRVIERFGEEVDYQLKHNIRTKEVEETVTDEKGKTKTIVKTVNVIDPQDVSGYARFFEKYTRDEEGNVIENPHWETSGEYRLMFLKSVERYMNDRLRAYKRVFLNEVYEALGLPRSKEGQIVGWVYNPDNPVGDNYIDFGLYKFEQNYSDFVYGENEAILLDFNVDGNIWELM